MLPGIDADDLEKTMTLGGDFQGEISMVFWTHDLFFYRFLGLNQMNSGYKK